MSSELDSIKLYAEKVVFSLKLAKTHTIPSCAATLPQNSNMWTFSLNDLHGRAMYSMLMTAVAKQQKVTVFSAQTCIDNLEEVASLKLTVLTSPVIASSDKLFLYKGDGQTKLGIYAGIPTAGTIEYFPLEGPFHIQYHKQSVQGLYYLNPQCEGDVYLNSNKTVVDSKSHHFIRPLINSNNSYVTMKKHYPEKTIYFYQKKSDTCQNTGRTNILDGGSYYKGEEFEHPLCGRLGCIVK